MAKRNAQGNGTIRHRSDGTWEARYTYQDELGQPKRASVYGKTQKECRQKLTSILKQIDEGSFHRTVQKYTVSEWMAEWTNTYCTNLKPLTVQDYQSKINRYIIPNLGKSQLSALTPTIIQRFCNRLTNGYKEQKPLSPKTVKNIHGILHSALKQAVLSGIISANPADNAKLPKTKKPELKPLMDEQVHQFLKAIEGDPYESIYIVDLFTGLRQSEILGLQWDDVDFEKGELHVCRQLQKQRTGGYIFLDETKNGKSRTVPMAPSVVKVLQHQKAKQAEWRLAAGNAWRNEHNLVFTDELGGHLKHISVLKHFKRIVKQIGMPETRFHDLRHSCAILALEAGVPVKTVSESLGHFSSAFTMDVYTSTSEAMKKESQTKMEQVFQRVSTL